MSQRAAWIHPLVKAIILIGFAVYIAYLVRTDNLFIYISPRMELYVKLAALGMYAVGAHQIYTSIRAFAKKPDPCDCGHDHSHTQTPWKSVLVYGLFALPLALGFFMPDTTLGSALAAKRGMNINSAATLKPVAASVGAVKPDSKQPPLSPPAVSTEAQLEKLFPDDSLTGAFAKLARKLYPLELITVPEDLYVETLTTLDLYAKPFTGKKISLSGFVYRDETMSSGQLVVGRFSIQCCSADGAPFGVLVSTNLAAAYRDDDWVEITGTIGVTPYGGAETMVVQAERIIRITPPKQQYVYPNDNFGS